jgi:hypothetical protein
LKYLFPAHRFKLGEDGDGKRIDIPIEEYDDYIATNRDEHPLYIFENDLTKESIEGRPLHSYYTVPSLFEEDLFNLIGESRP